MNTSCPVPVLENRYVSVSPSGKVLLQLSQMDYSTTLFITDDADGMINTKILMTTLCFQVT
jgi:hypothetical protein